MYAQSAYAHCTFIRTRPYVELRTRAKQLAQLGCQWSRKSKLENHGPFPAPWRSYLQQKLFVSLMVSLQNYYFHREITPETRDQVHGKQDGCKDS